MCSLQRQQLVRHLTFRSQTPLLPTTSRAYTSPSPHESSFSSSSSSSNSFSLSSVISQSFGRRPRPLNGRLKVLPSAQELRPDRKSDVGQRHRYVSLQHEPRCLPSRLLSHKLAERESELVVKHDCHGFRLRRGAAESRVTAQLYLHPGSFMAVHPDEEARVLRVRDAVRDSVRPILGEALLES